MLCLRSASCVETFHHLTQRWPVAPGCGVPKGTCSPHGASLYCGTPRPSVLQMPPGIRGDNLK